MHISSLLPSPHFAWGFRVLFSFFFSPVFHSRPGTRNPVAPQQPRKSVRLTWENKSAYTEFVSLFRNFDFSVGKMLTHELFKIVEFYYLSCGPLCSTLLRGRGNVPGPVVVRSDISKALSWFCGWWYMSVLSSSRVPSVQGGDTSVCRGATFVEGKGSVS